MDITELIEKIRQNKECKVYEPCGLPRVNENEVLPDDIKRFIIARNFTELILKLYENEGRGLFWLEDDFETLGDAYDDI